MPKPMLTRTLTLSAAVLAVVLAEATRPASAATCAQAPITARSEESRYEWLAKTKARANWRRKVRAMTDLGPAYSNWGQAAETEEKCMTGPAGSVCTFIGTPCKP